MEGLKKRAVPLIVCTALILAGWLGGLSIQNHQNELLTLKASGLRGSTVVMQVGDREIKADRYLATLTATCDSIYQQFGIEDWSAPLTEDMTVGQYAKQLTDKYIVEDAAKMMLAEENGIALTEEQNTALDGFMDYQAEYFGGEDALHFMMRFAGLNEDLMLESAGEFMIFDGLKLKLMEEGGILEPTEERLAAFAEKHNLKEMEDQNILAFYQDTDQGGFRDYIEEYIVEFEPVHTENYDKIVVEEFYPALELEREALVANVEENTPKAE